MPPRDWRFRAEDVLEAIRRIDSYVKGLDAGSFARNPMIVDAVVRNLTVIGEAARHFPEDVQARHPHVPWREMRDMRNLMVHEYFGASLDIVWETVQRDLEPLAKSMEDLLGSDA